MWATGLFEDVRFDREDGVLVIHVEATHARAQAQELVRLGGSLSSLPIGSKVRSSRKTSFSKAWYRRSGFDLHTNRAFGRDDARTVERLTQQFLGEEVDVRARVESLADTRVELVLAVEKVPTKLLSSLDLVGNEGLTDAELRDVMHLKPRDWTTRITGRDKLSQRVLDADLDSLRTLYRSRGFRDIRVGPVELDEALRIPIVEGRRYRLDAVTIEPGSLLSQDEANDWLPSPGGIYDASALDAVTASTTSPKS